MIIIILFTLVTLIAHRDPSCRSTLGHRVYLNLRLPNQRRVLELLPKGAVATLHDVDLREEKLWVHVDVASSVILSQARV